MVETFYRTGSLVFGGGHVVLPLLDAGVVDPGWVSEDRFLAGYGAAQAVPGPLFSFAAYLGAVSAPPLGGWSGATVALVAIYLPSFLLIFGVLPYWDRLRQSAAFRRALVGANAAVVGLLAAALYRPIWTGAIESGADVVVAVAGLGAAGPRSRCRRSWSSCWPPLPVRSCVADGAGSPGASLASYRGVIRRGRTRRRAR